MGWLTRGAQDIFGKEFGRTVAQATTRQAEGFLDDTRDYWRVELFGLPPLVRAPVVKNQNVNYTAPEPPWYEKHAPYIAAGGALVGTYLLMRGKRR